MKNLFILVACAIFALTGCQYLNGQNLANSSPSPVINNCVQYSANQDPSISYVASDTLDPAKIVRGQKLYIPFYSQIYQPEGRIRFDLFGTLSIRNTSETDKIRITKVYYFNTSGELVKKCLEGKHLILSPMATAEFGITRQDDSGGSGANFIVEWVSETPLSDPVVEAIMLASSANTSYSLLTSARVIEEFKPQKYGND